VTGPTLIVFWILAAFTLIVIIRQHIGYFRRARRMTFGAFLETAGWVIVFLAAVAALRGGLAHPDTRVVELSTGIAGGVCIALGSVLR